MTRMPLYHPRSCLWSFFISLVSLTAVPDIAASATQPFPSPQVETSCHTPNDCFQTAVAGISKVKRGTPGFDKAVTALRQVQTRFPGTLWEKRAGIHLGLLLTRAEPETGLQFFRTALQDFPILEDYVRMWMGKALLKASRFREAAQVFEAIVKHIPDSRLRDDALFWGGEAYSLAGDCGPAVNLIRQAFQDQPESSLAPAGLLTLGKCELSLNRPQVARAALREVWWRFPTRLEAALALAMLEQNPVKGGQGPTLDERYKRALAFFNQAAFAHAVSELQQYLRDASAGPQYFEAQYHLGLAFARLKQYDQAEKVFKRLSTSQSRRAGIGTVWLGRAYLRQNKGSALIALQEEPIFRTITGDQQALIHVFTGIWFEDQGDAGQAIRSFRRALQIGRSSERRLDALWRIGWKHYQLGEYSQAITAFKEMHHIRDPGDEHARASYWVARSMENLNQNTQAQEIYRELVERFPFTYYGQLAQVRLPPPTSGFVSVTGETAPVPSDSKVSSQLERDEHFQKARELIGLNLFQEATGELRSLKRNFSWDQAALSHFLSLVHQAQAYDIGVRMALERYGKQLEQGRIPRSSEIWSWAYPNGYIPTIQAHAGPGLDPYLVAGLIREESLFNPFAVSPVGALGLMQLMPETADGVARRLGIAKLDREDLFDAEANIQIGTMYVNELLDLFQGNVIQTVAAYNAGPVAVNGWLARNGQQQPDEFIESIAYRETRGYVKRVVGSYRVYRTLSAQSCRADSLDRIC